MTKLLSVLIAGLCAVVSTTGYAQEKKANAPAAEMKKDSAKKAGTSAKKGTKKGGKKGKKSTKAAAADSAPKK